MKAMTFGWISVFLIILIMNIYVWHCYWQIPFQETREVKVISYLVIHVSLTIVSVYYFYLFFDGKVETRGTSILSYIAGFYITFLHYSMIFYLIHDLIYFSERFISYPEGFKTFTEKLFFGGFLIFGISAIISIYGLYNSNKIITKDYTIEIDSKDSIINELNIVFISDAHIGTSLNLENIDDIILDINKLKPDILFLGGDFFDEGTTHNSKKIISEKLGKIESKYGTYAIEGNHEYKSGDCDIDEEMGYLSDQGIVVLQDNFVEIKDKFYLVGRRDKKGDMKDLDKVMSKVDKDLPIILLDHRPTYEESSEIDKIDLQISGHTHSGQFFPTQIFDRLISFMSNEYIYGFHEVNGLKHVVSSGIGNWGIPVRLGSTREILRIDLQFK